MILKKSIERAEGAWWAQPIRTSQASRGLAPVYQSLGAGEYTPSVIIAITIAQIFKEPVENVFSLVEEEE